MSLKNMSSLLILWLTLFALKVQGEKSNINGNVQNYAAGTTVRTTRVDKQDKPSETKQNNYSTSTPHVINVMQMSLNDEDKVMLQNLKGIIAKVPERRDNEVTREGKFFKDEQLRRAAEALTDDEITEIIKSISFPNKDDITEDSEALAPAPDMKVEPRSVDEVRRAKALHESQGYYVITFTPVEEETTNNGKGIVPYTRLQILPVARSMTDDASDDPRLISKKSWNKFIRRIMRQIRKGTRRIQRKTKVKSLNEEPTVENFLKHMYKLTQEQRL